MITTDQANFNGDYTYGGSAKGVNRQKTIEVGSLKKPNAFGLHDMHGNVWEWVEDCYQNNYATRQQTDRPNRARVANFAFSAAALGSTFPQFSRSAYRGRDFSYSRAGLLGFG